MAAGNTAVVKPATQTPLTALVLGDLLRQAGLPEAWCDTLITEQNALAEKLATDARVAFLSFIGSARVGWSLRSKLANFYAERTLSDLDRFRAEGGRMHWLCLGKPDWAEHPERIAEAEGELKTITGAPVVKSSYAGRTLFYEDCVRDVELDVGARVLDQLAGPLSLLSGNDDVVLIDQHAFPRDKAAGLKREFDAVSLATWGQG